MAVREEEGLRMAKFIMNTSILPNDGLFQMQTVDEETAKAWAAEGGWVSAVGYLIRMLNR